MIVAVGVTALAQGGRGFSRPDPLDFDDHTGWTSIFDGVSLKGWNVNPAVWTVENGAITAASTPERMIGSSYALWDAGELADFEWKLEDKLDGDIHSGIAYRSWTDPNRAATLGPAVTPPPAPPRAGGPAPGGAGRGRGAPPQIPVDPRWTLYGPGMDNDADRRNTGHVEDRGTARRFVSWRGSVVRAEAGKLPRVIGTLGDPAVLMEHIKAGDWNQVHIIARGNQILHIVNGQLMTVLIDEDQTFFTPKGLIGWSIEGGATGRVSVRNIWLKNSTCPACMAAAGSQDLRVLKERR
jgi:hypothetical protein